jgi:hypothetical protein
VIRRKYEQEREELIAIYITQGRYTSDAVKGMVANPENREKAVAVTTEAPQWHQRQRGRIRIRPPALISTRRQ